MQKFHSLVPSDRSCSLSQYSLLSWPNSQCISHHFSELFMGVCFNLETNRIGNTRSLWPLVMKPDVPSPSDFQILRASRAKFLIVGKPGQSEEWPVVRRACVSLCGSQGRRRVLREGLGAFCLVARQFEGHCLLRTTVHCHSWRLRSGQVLCFSDVCLKPQGQVCHLGNNLLCNSDHSH